MARQVASVPDLRRGDPAQLLQQGRDLEAVPAHSKLRLRLVQLLVQVEVRLTLQGAVALRRKAELLQRRVSSLDIRRLQGRSATDERQSTTGCLRRRRSLHDGVALGL